MVLNNARMRAALLALSPRMTKDLGNTTVTQNAGTARIKLYNVGIITRLWLDVTINYTPAVGADAVASLQAPYNFISRVRLTDYDGTDRVNISGFGLHVLNSKRQRGRNAYAKQTLTGTAAGAGALVTTDQNVGLEIPNLSITGGATARVGRFMIEIPLAYESESDLRGAILAQTALGEMYLNLDFLSFTTTAGGVDNLFSTAHGAAPTFTSVVVRVFQDYLLPQAVGGEVPIPSMDLLTVYELTELKSTDNLVAAGEKLINYPNVRSVLGLLTWYNTAATQATLAQLVADVTKLRIIANGNSILTDLTAQNHLIRQRMEMNGMDMIAPVFIHDHSKKPVETAIFGNVQLGFTPATVAAVAHINTVFESMYSKGTVLPGLTQSN